MDFIKKWFLKRASFPVSESTAYLMFANTAYSSEKAREAFGFQARPSVETFSDHFQDLINRDLIEVAREQRALSIW